MTGLRWRREGFSRHTEPETWILSAATGPAWARIQRREGQWVCLSHTDRGPWPSFRLAADEMRLEAGAAPAEGRVPAETLIPRRPIPLDDALKMVGKDLKDA